MAIEQKLFGKTADGKDVFAFTLRDELSRSATLLNYGCVIKDTVVLDRAGNFVDVTLGYDTLAEYEADTCALGALMGRVANRIAGASFALDGKSYTLAKNNGNNCLHGGLRGFGVQLYDFAVDGDTLVFTRTSPAGEEGFPGALTFTQKTTFKDGRLRLEFIYTADADTIASFTNHNYFNLDGAGAPSIDDTMVKINADHYCNVDENQVAQAPPAPVGGTVFDFLSFKPLGQDLYKDTEQLNIPGGYDHFWVARDASGRAPMAEAYSQASGIKLSAFTDMPGMLMYTANAMPEIAGKAGRTYKKQSAFCFECGDYPNAANEPSFPGIVVKAGEAKRQFMEFQFDVLS